MAADGTAYGTDPTQLLGTEMVNVTTPDGRQLSVPAQLAAGLQPPVSSPQPDQAATPATTQASQTAADQPTPLYSYGAQQPKPDAQGAPAGSSSPTPLISQIGGQSQGTPVVSQLAAGGQGVPAPAQSVQPGPTTPTYTNAGLAKQGTAGALNTELGALNERKAAARRAADVEGSLATGEAALVGAGSQQAAQADAERRKVADAAAEELRRRMVAYDENAKAIANTKVDRSIDHPVIAAISLALSGIGSALKKESTNPALDVLFKVIDRKVAAQMADLENRRAGLSAQLTGISLARQASSDRLAEYDQRKIAALEQAKRSVEEYKLRTTNDRVRSNADVVSAALDSEAAKIVGDATQREQQRIAAEQQHNAQLGFQYAQLGETRRHNISEEQLAEEQRAIAAAKLSLEGKNEQAKLVRERALGGEVETDAKGNPIPLRSEDGSVVTNETGAPVPKVGLLKLKGGDVFIPNGTQEDVTRLHKAHAAVLKLIETQDQIRRLGPEWLSNIRNTDKKQQLDQLFGQARLQAIEANNLGVPTGHDIELAENFLGTTDPTRWKDSLAGINQARKSLVAAHSKELQAYGYDRAWSVPDLGNRGATQAPDDKQLAGVLKDPLRGGGDAAQLKAELGGIPFVGGARALLPENVRATEAVRESGRILPSQANVIAGWGNAARGSDPAARAKAVSFLEQAAKSGGSAAIRSAAQQELNNSISQYSAESVPDDKPPEAATGRSSSSDSVPAYARPKRRDSAGNPL